MLQELNHYIKLAILFLHIPKTAGTFIVSSVLQSQCMAQEASDSDGLRSAIREQNQFIYGHFRMNDLLAAEVPFSGYKLVTLIRNPFDMFISNINYHVEILTRSLDFFRGHPPDWRILIIKTYRELQRLHATGSADFSHLFEMMLQENTANWLLPANEVVNAHSSSVSSARGLLDTAMSRFSFVGVVEREGVESLRSCIETDLALNISLNNADRNSSTNYVYYEYILPTLIASVKRSPVSNLLQIMLDCQGQGGGVKLKTWDEVQEVALNIFTSTCRYKTKATNPMPQLNLSMLD